jgi:type I restriction enzyme S subunit
MQPLEAEPRFLRYVCLWRDFVDAVDASTFGSKMPRADWDFIGNMPIPVPGPGKQTAIADYLDRETARIDALITAKERLLALLAEKRRALITRAVTRGLDTHAPLRDSGIPWLGEIPAHWETWKVGHLALIGNGSTPDRDNREYWAEGSIPWLNSSVVNQGEVTVSDQFVTPAALRECHLPLVRPGSVLVGITGQGRTRGQAVVLAFEATINQHIAYITPRAELLDAWFLRWTFLAAYQFLRSISDDAGGTKGALTCEEVASLRVTLPPLSEQLDIAAHIASVTKRLDHVRLTTEKSIALLKERRSALIAAAVTGQIPVEAAA